MWEWLHRYYERQREIQQGADADLFRENQKRWRRSWLLFGCSFLLIAVQSLVKFSGNWHSIFVVLTMVFFVGGLFMAHWARAEKSFLEEPGPKEPPSLFK
jgi:hypothetical protein